MCEGAEVPVKKVSSQPEDHPSAINGFENVELDLRFSPRLSEGKPPLAEVKRSLRLVRKATIMGFAGIITWFLIIWPIMSPTTKEFPYTQFYVWIFGIRLWNVLGMIACITVPIVLAITKYLNVHKEKDENVLITFAETQSAKTEKNGSSAKLRTNSTCNIVKILALSGTALDALPDGDRVRLTGLLLISVGVCTIYGHFGSLPVILYFTTAFLVIFTTVLATLVLDFSQNFPLALLVNFLSNNAHWMVSVAVSPNQGSISFFLASYTVFSVSILFATCLGLGYAVLSTSLGKPIWELESVVLKPFAVPAFIAGRRGIILMYCVVIITSVASCACNVLGLISLILNDFVQTSLKDGALNVLIFLMVTIFALWQPFKRTESIADCLLCGKSQGNFSDRRSECRCCSIVDCADGSLDKIQCQASIKNTIMAFTCRIHGIYHTYQADMKLIWPSYWFSFWSASHQQQFFSRTNR
ncbi:unnamed protein product [Dibothriocephalus latus]|uniref:Uncharacterized protein n=1 Tax=Dibothriocephalus latus TaxID=60516 RepID=A0A3P6UBU0_DIBLA|nr:unnamed protein product [Dibothriocephalus latus]